MSGLILRNIHKRFADNLVLDDISLELEAGELLVLLGPSGCGKSTLLRIIAGLEEVDGGEVHINGRRVEHLRPRDRNVALVFQNYSLYPHMTVGGNLAFPLKVAGLKRDEIRHRVQRVAEMLDLANRLGDRPGQLSGGQRQRVALGRAIIRDPSIFLLDEPLSNLDAELRVRMRQEIVRIQKELKVTTVHVTHDQTEALTMADRVALLLNNRIEQVGTPQQLYRQPASRAVAEFIGQPKINIIEVHTDKGRVIPFGFEMPGNLAGVSDGKLLIGLRPEAIELCGDGEYQATVEGREFLGDHYVLKLQFQELALTVSNIPSPAPEIGQTIRFSFDKESVFYFDAKEGRNLL